MNAFDYRDPSSETGGQGAAMRNRLVARLVRAHSRTASDRSARMKDFFTQKLLWNNANNFPHTTFNWVGLDGTQVLRHMVPVDTYIAQAMVGDVNRAVAGHKNLESSDTSLLIFGNGDSGVDKFFVHLAARSDQGKVLPNWGGSCGRFELTLTKYDSHLPVPMQTLGDPSTGTEYPLPTSPEIEPEPDPGPGPEPDPNDPAARSGRTPDIHAAAESVLVRTGPGALNAVPLVNPWLVPRTSSRLSRWATQLEFGWVEVVAQGPLRTSVRAEVEYGDGNINITISLNAVPATTKLDSSHPAYAHPSCPLPMSAFCDCTTQNAMRSVTTKPLLACLMRPTPRTSPLMRECPHMSDRRPCPGLHLAATPAALRGRTPAIEAFTTAAHHADADLRASCTPHWTRFFHLAHHTDLRGSCTLHALQRGG
ncbi:hypothetical protein B0H19DRAFT_1261722 [Mycena capillaripes]|nr:hypothetical protein B0H19DRAFT_1261722 [Mycena capillaripes]